MIGIYYIKGPNGRCYVGQSLNIPVRWRHHRNVLRRGIHRNEKLQHAWNKHGETCFTFAVILICAIHDLDFYEQRAINALNAVCDGYNVVPHAGPVRRGMKNPSVAARNRQLRGSSHPSWGKSRPDLANRNRAGSPMKGKKRPDVAVRASLRGPENVNFGRRHAYKPRPRQPHKLQEHAEIIVSRLSKGESMKSLAREFCVDHRTIKRIRLWHSNNGSERNPRT